jgi:hypothetical protein
MIKYTPIPTLASSSPASVPTSSTSRTLQLTGTGLQNGATVSFSGTGITVTGTTWVSSTRIDVTIDVASTAATGLRDITVTQPDGSVATAPNALTLTVPSLTVSLSALGYADTVRDTTAPIGLDFGAFVAGSPRMIGPVGSGQTTAGAAIIVSTTGDSNYQLHVDTTQFTSGANSLPSANFTGRDFGTADPWVPWPTATTLWESVSPGSTSFSYDMRVDLPLAQPTGAYSATMTWTVVPTP